MRTILATVLPAVFGAGCVIVNPSDVHVSASPVPVVVDVPRPSGPPQAPYGHALHHVLRQQEKVAKELTKRDWKELHGETNDWMRYTRELSGLANASSDPPRLRSYCEQLLDRIERLRDSAVRHDAAGCEQALRYCDPILDRLSREFPAAVAPSAQPHPRPASAGSGRAP